MNEVVQILDNIVATKNIFTVDNATFLASAITATLVTMVTQSQKFGLCGKEQCKADLICLKNGGDCPDEKTR